MTCRELQELAAAHAAGALPPAEVARLEAEVAANPDALAEWKTWQEASVAYALAASPGKSPPAETRLALISAMSDSGPAKCVALDELVAENPNERTPAMHALAALLATALAPRREPPAALRTRLLEKVAGRPPGKSAGAGAPGRAAAEDALPAVTPLAPGFRLVRPEDHVWQELPFPGCRLALLSTSADMGYRVHLLEMGPGSRLPEHPHGGSEDVYVLTGNLLNENRLLGPGDFFHSDAGTVHHELLSPDGCTALLIDRAPAHAG